MGEQFGKRITDLVVVIPGILGSRLSKDGQEVWGTSARRLLTNIVTFGKRVRTSLAIPDDVDPDDPRDGVTADGLITSLNVLPGLFGMDFYDDLRHHLRGDLELRPDQLVDFPYDWRLSCRVNGKRLTSFLDEQLRRYHESSGITDARAILVAHSMGGLVARWCLEHEGGDALTRTLVTIGTPHKGSVLALDALVNGVKLPRRLGVDLTAMALSFPSIYELLPTYRCVAVDGAARAALGDEAVAARIASIVPDGVGARITTGLDFHTQLARRIAERPGPGPYELICFRGAEQPTPAVATVAGTTLVTTGTIDGVSHGGDGVVPADSAVPAEWASSAAAKSVKQKHSTMANGASVREEVRVALRNSGRLLGPPADLAADLPAVIAAGTTVEFPVTVLRDANGKQPKVPLVVRIEPQVVDVQVATSERAVIRRGDTYSATIDALAPGLYRIAVVGAKQATPVNPLADSLVVLGED